MRIVACGLIAGAALLGAAPVAMADVAVSERVSTTTGTSSARTNSDGRAAPQSEVSMLAVSLTVGGAVAMAGSGVALVLTRRRASLTRFMERLAEDEADGAAEGDDSHHEPHRVIADMPGVKGAEPAKER